MVHAAYFSFVVLGLVAILLGIAFAGSGSAIRGFAAIHITMIGIVVAEVLAGIPCPLTVWERQLREAAGQVAYPGDFIGYWTHRLLFVRVERWVFTVVYATFGLAVLAAFILAPPRWRRQLATAPGQLTKTNRRRITCRASSSNSFSAVVEGSNDE